MKTKNLFTIAVLTVSLIIYGCNPLGKMIKNATQVSYEVSPNPVEMHGDSVELTISGKFPPNYFHKKAKVVVTPFMTPSGEEGTVVKELKGISLIGEAADGEGTKIAYASGGSFSYTDVIPYEKAMEDIDIRVKAVGSFKGKSKEFPSVKVGDGTNITPLLVQNDDRPLLGADNFKKVVPRTYNADIHYLVNSSYVRPGELREDDIKGMQEFVETGVEKEYNFKGVDIEAYASPEGEISLNENLANERAESAKKYIDKILSKHNVETGEDFYSLQGKGEDWQGFKEMMEASDIEDKDLIIRVLTMYDDVTKREQEIKNMAKTYVEIADKILPKLRRAQITIKAEEKSKTDEEIKQLAETAPDSLTTEELLYAATLFESEDKKLEIYKAFTEVYPEDWRGPNNIGYIYMMKNRLEDAKKQFEKAAELAPNEPIIASNLGVVARWKGDRMYAKEQYNAALGAGSDVKYNLGIINILEGDYADAVSNFGSAKTFNAALAKLLNADPDGAMKTIEQSENKDTALGNYLKAIIAARQDNKDLMYSSLKEAVNKDASLKEKAKKDVEFIRFQSETEFQEIVQ